MYIPMNVLRESRVRKALICSFTSVTVDVVVVVVDGDAVFEVVGTIGGANRIPLLLPPPRNCTNGCCGCKKNDGILVTDGIRVIRGLS